MSANSDQSSNPKEIVSPDSAIESATRRSSIRITSPSNRSYKNSRCESTIESSLRRDFIKKAALITAAAGVSGAIVAQPLTAKILPKSEAADGCTLIIGQNNFGNVNGCTTMLTACVKRPTNGSLGGGGFFVENNNACAEAAIVGRIGVCNAGTASGIIGCSASPNGVGVLARNIRGGIAFVACTDSPFIAKFKNFGVVSDRTALIQFETGDCIPLSWYTGVAGIGNGLGLANGTFFIENFAGSEVVIGSNNNVGIGTTTPNAKISLGEFVGDSFFAYDGSSNKYGLGIRVNELRVFNGIGTLPHTSFGNYDGTTFTEFMRLTNQGNLGVGTSTPGFRLHVTAPNQLGIHVEGPSSGIGAGLTFQTTGASPQGWEILDTGTTSTQGANKLNIRNLNTSKDVLTISEANLGVGTTTPSSTLCVVGSISASSSVSGNSCSGDGVLGRSKSGPGIAGISSSGPGVFGAASANPVAGKFKNFSTSGDRTALVQFENGDTTAVDWFAGVAGTSNVCKIADGSFYVGQTAKPRVVVNTSGQVGIGTIAPRTTLAVNGSVSARTVKPTGNYVMGASDFAVLTNATSAISVTLPSANTSSGMIVFIKNLTGNAVTVKAHSASDNIEGSSSKPLSTKFSSLTLLSDGINTWVILSNAT